MNQAIHGQAVFVSLMGDKNEKENTIMEPRINNITYEIYACYRK